MPIIVAVGHVYLFLHELKRERSIEEVPFSIYMVIRNEKLMHERVLTLAHGNIKE